MGFPQSSDGVYLHDGIPLESHCRKQGVATAGASPTSPQGEAGRGLGEPGVGAKGERGGGGQGSPARRKPRPRPRKPPQPIRRTRRRRRIPSLPLEWSSRRPKQPVALRAAACPRHTRLASAPAGRRSAPAGRTPQLFSSAIHFEGLLVPAVVVGLVRPHGGFGEASWFAVNRWPSRKDPRFPDGKVPQIFPRQASTCPGVADLF